MHILINWFLSGLAVFIASYILPGVHVADFTTALIVALVLGIMNAFVKPILTLLTLPITIMTLGLFSLVLGLLLLLITDALIPGFTIDNFLWAIIFSFTLSVINSVLFSLAKK